MYLCVVLCLVLQCTRLLPAFRRELLQHLVLAAPHHHRGCDQTVQFLLIFGPTGLAIPDTKERGRRYTHESKPDQT
jgi:hypothetical protein